MIATAEGKFLGVGSGSSSRGTYYNCTIFDGEGPIKFRATEEVWSVGQRLEFGKAVEVDLSIGTYNGNPTLRVTHIQEI